MQDVANDDTTKRVPTVIGTMWVAKLIKKPLLGFYLTRESDTTGTSSLTIGDDALE
jgi:hypothetical protein